MEFTDAVTAAFEDGYIDCALWAELDDEGVALDENHDRDDVAPDSLDAMRGFCRAFIASNRDDLADMAERFSVKPAEMGRLTWLSRGGHGAGWFDFFTPTADRLQSAARTWGESSLYVGDNGQVHVTTLDEADAA